MRLPTLTINNKFSVLTLLDDDQHEVNLYFSYQTLIAFSTANRGLVCRTNEWGPTTGKHMNMVEPNKSNRVNSEQFENEFAACVMISQNPLIFNGSQTADNKWEQ